MNTKTNVNALVFRRKLVHGLLIAFCSLVAITAFSPAGQKRSEWAARNV